MVARDLVGYPIPAVRVETDWISCAGRQDTFKKLGSIRELQLEALVEALGNRTNLIRLRKVVEGEIHIAECAIRRCACRYKQIYVAGPA